MDNKTVHGYNTPHGYRTPHKWPSNTPDKEVVDNLTKSLYPTGRAWAMKSGSVFDRFNDALNKSIISITSISDSYLNSLLPDNTDFDEEDLEMWNYRFGLNEGLDVLKNRFQYYKRNACKQNIHYLQYMIDLYGYNAKIYENTPPYTSPDTILGEREVNQHSNFIQHGENVQHGGANYMVIANESNINESYTYGGNNNLWATFFIASKDSINLPASIPSNELENFRKLILKIKPAHLIAFLFNS